MMDKMSVCPLFRGASVFNYTTSYMKKLAISFHSDIITKKGEKAI